MFRVIVPAATVTNRVLHFEVITRVVKTLEFGYKLGEGFGKHATNPYSIYMGVPLAFYGHQF